MSHFKPAVDEKNKDQTSAARRDIGSDEVVPG